MRQAAPKAFLILFLGAGSVVGARIAEHPDIDAVSFTGSVPTGRQIGVTCASLGKKVQMEMGGKNPMVVMDDADLQVAVGASLNGAFFSTGQRCTASSRLIVTKGIYDEFVDALTKAADKLVVGDPLDSATQIGPVVDEKQLQQNVDYVKLAADEGCDVRGGESRTAPAFPKACCVYRQRPMTCGYHVKKFLGPVLQ